MFQRVMIVGMKEDHMGYTILVCKRNEKCRGLYSWHNSVEHHDWGRFPNHQGIRDNYSTIGKLSRNKIRCGVSCYIKN